jgi:hypothetical protein
MTKREWYIAYHNYRHLEWMTRNYFAHKRSHGKRQTTWKGITRARVDAALPLNMLGKLRAAHTWGDARQRPYPNPPRYFWLTACLNAPGDPYWNKPVGNYIPEDRPHMWTTYDTRGHWNYVTGESPETARERIAAGRPLDRQGHYSLKYQCGNWRKWQNVLHAPALSRDVTDLEPELGGKFAQCG